MSSSDRHDALVPLRAFSVQDEGITHLASAFSPLTWKSSEKVPGWFLQEQNQSSPDVLRSLQVVKDELRKRLAALVGGTTEQVAFAFASNTTEALIKILQCMEEEIVPDDNIVIPENSYSTLLRLGESLNRIRGAEVRLTGATTEEISRAIVPGTKLVLAGGSDYVSYTRADWEEIRNRADQVGARVILDISQEVGVFAQDYRLWDAAAFAPYKPVGGFTNGCAPLCLNRSRWSEETIQPRYRGWGSDCMGEDGQYELKADIGDRLNPGGLPWLNIYYLLDALRNLQRLDQREISTHVLALGDQILDGLEELVPGEIILTPRAHRQRGGAIAIAMPDEIAKEVCRRLYTRDNVKCSFGQNRFRISAWIYNSTEDIEHFIAAFPSALRYVGYHHLLEAR